MISAPDHRHQDHPRAQVIARRRDQRRAPALEEEQVGEQADQPQQRQRHVRTKSVRCTTASPEMDRTRGVMVKSPSVLGASCRYALIPPAHALATDRCSAVTSSGPELAQLGAM